MKVRVKKVLFLVWILIAFGNGFFFVPSVSADKVQFSQKIMPVTFVYIGKNQAIIETWSNVSKEDDSYVLKFFDATKKSELSVTDDLLASYVSHETYSKKSAPSEVVQFKKENGIINQIITAT